MVVVSIIAVIVVVVVVVKVLVWAAAVINMVVVVEVLALNVEVIVVGGIVRVLSFDFPVSYSVDVPSDVAVGLFVDALTHGVLSGISIEVLADVSANAFTVIMTALECPVSTPLEGFSR